MGFNLFDPFGAAEKLLGDPFGTGAAKKAAKGNKANLAKIGGLYESALGEYGQESGAAIQRQKAVTGDLRRGLKTGLLNLAGQGTAARQGVLDRAQGSLETAQAQIQDRGVMSAALGEALRRSSNYDVNTALQGIDEAIARLAADFQFQGEQAVAESGSREAGLIGQRASGRAGITQNYMGILGGVQHTAQPGWLAQLAPAIGAFAGAKL